MPKTDFKRKSKRDLGGSDLISMYRLMVLIREFEMRVCQIYSQKGLPELPHSCIGEEAVGVGSCYGLKRDDYVLPSLRGRSVFLTKGVSPSILMAGIYGKATGPSKGKWTAHHMGDLEKGILAGSLIIGSQFPTAVGAGLAFKIKKTDQVCLCYFGDGASNRGDFKGILDRFGEDRIIDTPISESGFVGAAVGAALLGTRPVVDLMFNDFLPLTMDHIANHAAKMRYMYGGKAKVPMVIRVFFGAGTTSGCSHSQSLEALVIHCPGLKVVMPSTPADAKGLMKSAIRDDDPVIFFEHRLLYAMEGEVPEGEYIVPLGQADVKREGRDVTVVATAMMVHKALDAAVELSRGGIEIEVLDPRSLLPLDCEALISSIKKTGRLLIVHEACKTGGIGGEIAAIAAKEAFGYLDAPIERIGAPDIPVPFSPPLENYYIPKKEDIVTTVRSMLS